MTSWRLAGASKYVLTEFAHLLQARQVFQKRTNDTPVKWNVKRDVPGRRGERALSSVWVFILKNLTLWKMNVKKTMLFLPPQKTLLFKKIYSSLCLLLKKEMCEIMYSICLDGDESLHDRPFQSPPPPPFAAYRKFSALLPDASSLDNCQMLDRETSKQASNTAKWTSGLIS